MPLGVLWWWLCLHVPVFGWAGLSPFLDGKRFTLSHDQGRFHECVVLDVERQHYDMVKEPIAGFPPGRAGFSANTTVVATDKTQNILRLELYNHKEKRVTRSIETSLPLDNFLRIVSERFVVADTDVEIRWLDLLDTTETWHAFPILRGDDSWLWKHPTLPVFRRSAFKPIPPRSTQAPQSYTELFGFDERGQLSMLSSWPTSHSGYQTLSNAWFQENTIASLAPSGSFIELRSLEDGKLSGTLELIPSVDLSKQKFSLNYGRLTIDDGSRWRHYCLAHEKWLVPPLDVQDLWSRAIMELSPDSRIAIWQSRSERAAVITDTQTDLPVCKIQAPGERYQFLDAQTLISIDAWFGLTVRKHDLTTGAALLTWRPFWWVLPTFAFAILISIAWIVAWLRMQRHSANWAWADLHILLCLLMVLIVFRLRVAGNPADTMRMPYQHAIYVTSGYLFVAWAWLVLGRGSIISRLSQLLLVYAIILGGLSQALATDSHLAWMGVALVTMPNLLALPLFLTARLRDWGFAAVNKPQPQSPGVKKTEFVTLRQILVVTAVFAFLSLAARPLSSGLPGILQLQWPIWQAAGITASGVAAMFLATTQQPLLRRVGTVLAIGIVAMLVVEAFSIATYAGWRPIGWQQYQMPTRHCLGFYCTVFFATSVLYRTSRQAS